MSAIDNFIPANNSPSTPMTSAFAVTPDDNNELAYITRALLVTGTGNIVLVMMDMTQITLTSVPAYTWLSLRVRQVMATGTTATNIFGFY